jgi:CheY-like chemotaxis protein
MDPPTDRSLTPLAIVVADDDDDFRVAIVATLQAAGHSTREARDGRELLDLLEPGREESSLRPDVVLADLKMPKLSGLGVLETLRSANWKLPVVVMTGLRDESFGRVALRLGAVQVLQKPFGTADLLTALRNAADVDPHREPPH